METLENLPSTDPSEAEVIEKHIKKSTTRKKRSCRTVLWTERRAGKEGRRRNERAGSRSCRGRRGVVEIWTWVRVSAKVTPKIKQYKCLFSPSRSTGNFWIHLCLFTCTRVRISAKVTCLAHSVCFLPVAALEIYKFTLSVQLYQGANLCYAYCACWSIY